MLRGRARRGLEWLLLLLYVDCRAKFKTAGNKSLWNVANSKALRRMEREGEGLDLVGRFSGTGVSGHKLLGVRL